MCVRAQTTFNWASSRLVRHERIVCRASTIAGLKWQLWKTADWPPVFERANEWKAARQTRGIRLEERRAIVFALKHSCRRCHDQQQPWTDISAQCRSVGRHHRRRHSGHPRTRCDRSWGAQTHQLRVVAATCATTTTTKRTCTSNSKHAHQHEHTERRAKRRRRRRPSPFHFSICAAHALAPFQHSVRPPGG